MDAFIDKMKKNIILSKEDILLLRQNINERHPHLDDSSKAHILAKAIHNILNENLKGFTKDYKSNVKNNLIRNTFLNNKETIYQYDIFKACALSQDTSLEFIYQINKWLNIQLDEKIDLNVIKNIIQNMNIDLENNTQDNISLSKILEKNNKNIKKNDKNPPDNKEASDNEDVQDYKNTSDNENICTGDDASHNEKLNDNEAPSSEISTYSNSVIEYIIRLRDRIVEIIEVSMSNEKTRKYILIYSLALCLLLIPISHIIKNYIYKHREAFIELVTSAEYKEIDLESKNDDDIIVISKELKLMTNHLPDHFKYKKINRKGLKSYLIERNSLLSREPYFSTIIECAKEFNLNPILLFSIAGHEQSFVPKNHEEAKKIANNPYNVFRSWKNYNTDIADSSRIASRTVINLLKGRPENEDPFKWINRKYAEDKKWWKGVKSIYNTLEEVTATSY